MRKALLIILLFGCTGLMVQDVYSNRSCDGDTPTNIPIPLLPDSQPPTNRPIPLSLVPDVDANYYDGLLTVIFNSNLGYADITVTNTMTGEVWIESANGIGVTSIYTSSSAGYYTIYITTDRGDYQGGFTL